MSKPTKQQLELKNKDLITQYETLNEKYNRLLNENTALKQQINNGQLGLCYKIKNERCAGRKSVVTEEIKDKIYELYNSCWTMDQIAKKFELSKGTIFKVIHEPL